jgi:Uma2 family endonuclease
MAIPMEELIRRADEVGVRLEFFAGRAVWEASPVKRHQREIDRIRASITKASKCACVHYADVVMLFPDGSYKRPDIALFCSEPEEEDEAITLIPEAVVEVISKGYESKDLELAPTFYLAHGVKDVIIFDPPSKYVAHHRRDGVKTLLSPVEIVLECGCTFTI